MMSDTYYLCRAPVTGYVLMLKEGDYNYMRNHERGLYVPDPDNNLVLLAQGTKDEVKAYHNLITGRSLTNVS